MGVVLRHRLPVGICAVAVTLTAGFLVFARPQYRPTQGVTIKAPDKRPADDAAGAAGWSWPDGVPGWTPGYTIKTFNVSQIQPVEAQPAQLAAAHAQLDASRLRVLEAMHIAPGEAPLAIFAAPELDATEHTTCLAAMLPRPTMIEWRCPGSSHPYPDVAKSRVLLAAVARRWPTPPGTKPLRDDSVGFDLVGVARGDVTRVVLHIPNQTRLPDWTLYVRGKTWGQFSAAAAAPGDATTPELEIFGDEGLVQTVPLALAAGDQRIIG